GARNAKARAGSALERRKLNRGIADRGALHGTPHDLQPRALLQKPIKKAVAVATADDVNAPELLARHFADHAQNLGVARGQAEKSSCQTAAPPLALPAA